MSAGKMLHTDFKKLEETFVSTRNNYSTDLSRCYPFLSLERVLLSSHSICYSFSTTQFDIFAFKRTSLVLNPFFKIALELIKLLYYPSGYQAIYCDAGYQGGVVTTYQPPLNFVLGSRYCIV